jgi:signal transduction histidine kinase
MAAIISEMADFFEPRAMEKGLDIKAEAPRNLPLAMADPERIRQVLSNLIHNAIKFTNRGGITIFARSKAAHIEVGVKDTGVGIPKEKLAAVFEKFECLSDTRNRVEKPVPGSGLGLNIVMNSIKSQGGTIWVESEVGQGSSFKFTLPKAATEASVQANIFSRGG